MELVSEKECCGCRTCVAVCPNNAISVINDQYGFEQIKINQELCVECGRCKTVCPILNSEKNKGHYSCGSAYAISETEKRNGSSGGLFGTFAIKILEDGGIVYGAAFDEKLKLRTTRATNEDELISLYKSKYLLCDIGESFAEIKAKLDEGMHVLYCSSPCQIAGLRRFLGKDYEKLMLVDFVCHGVGSQYLFDESVKYIENKRGIDIKKYSFRYKMDKASSHHYYHYYYIRKNKKISKKDIYLTFPYYYAYCKSLVYRESCYKCPYADGNRPGDITIADFHTIEKYEPEADRFNISMFVCNTPKGQDFFETVKDRLKVTDYEWEIIRQNNRFNGGEVMPIMRKPFMDMIANGDFKKAVKKYLNPYKNWRMIYYHMPKWLRELGRKVLGGI